MELLVRLAPQPTSPGVARRVVDETFGGWGCEDLGEDARIVVTELVSNAVRHAGTELELSLELRPTELRIAVTDSASGEVAANRFIAPDSTGGRGLHMVETLADEWGVDYRVAGEQTSKTVWAAWHLPR